VVADDLFRKLEEQGYCFGIRILDIFACGASCAPFILVSPAIDEG
jgi:hypothetical protein